MKAADVVKLVETVAPISSGMKGDELGFVFGNGQVPVRGVAVCWSPTLRVIQKAGRLGCNMIIAHEALFYQKRWSVALEAKNVWFDETEDADKEINRRRTEALKRLNGCVWRAHTNWDAVPELGVIDMLAATLDFGPPIRRGRFTTVHRIAPITVRRLAARVKSRLKTGPVRVVGDLDRKVELVATLVGGLGQMCNSVEEVKSLGAEAVVAGECIAYTLLHAEELGLALIEAGHCAPENPGMRALAAWLARRLKGIPVEFIDTGVRWRCI